MEPHKIWVANLQDILLNHVSQGLLKTYDEILRICGGHKLRLTIQTAMEGIAHLSTHKINSDFRILLESLMKIGFTEKNLTDLIQNAYASYGLTALRAAGITCERIDVSMLKGPVGGAFIHEVYINVARHLWSNPDILIQRNVTQLQTYIKDGVEQAVRSGVNLNTLTEAIKAQAHETQEVQAVQAAPPVREPKQTLKERFNKLNAGKTLLDADSDEEIEEIMGSASFRTPELYSNSGDMTIDNDEFAPDNATITIGDEEEEEEDQITLNAIDMGPRNKTYELELEGDDKESVKSPVGTVMSNHGSAAMRATTRPIEMQSEPEFEPELASESTIPSFMIAGNITLINPKTKEQVINIEPGNDTRKQNDLNIELDLDESRDLRVSRKPFENKPPSKPIANIADHDDIPEFEESSQYTITLLSHSDMLSSRLNRLGL